MQPTSRSASKALLPWAMLLVFALLGARWLLAADGDDSSSRPTVRWQHLALTHEGKGNLSDRGLATRINKLGEEGWELVSVEGFSESGTTTKTVFFFKRRM